MVLKRADVRNNRRNSLAPATNLKGMMGILHLPCIHTTTRHCGIYAHLKESLSTFGAIALCIYLAFLCKAKQSLQTAKQASNPSVFTNLSSMDLKCLCKTSL